MEERADQEPGPDEQDEGDGDLARDEELQGAAPANDDAARRALECFASVDREGVDRRHGGRDERHQERRGEGEDDNRVVDGHHLDLGKSEVRDGGGKQGREAAGDPRGDENREPAADAGEDGPLDVRLAEEPAPRGAEGDAHRQVPPTRGGPGEGETGEVGAGGEQHESDRAGQGEERRPRVAADVLVE